MKFTTLKPCQVLTETTLMIDYNNSVDIILISPNVASKNKSKHQRRSECYVPSLYVNIKEEKIKLLTRFKFLVKVIKFSILNAAQSRFSSKGTL